jgi:hypothetical protein
MTYIPDFKEVPIAISLKAGMSSTTSTCLPCTSYILILAILWGLLFVNLQLPTKGLGLILRSESIKSCPRAVTAGLDNNTAVVESAGTVIVSEFEFTDTVFAFSAFCVCDTNVSVVGKDDN